MDTKELKVQIPEGYEIDKEKSTFEKIVFKKKDTKPMSWEEYLSKNRHPNKLWYIDPVYKSTNGVCCTKGSLKDYDLTKSGCCMAAYLPSKELAEAFLAMMQLMSLRKAWVGDWEPDWNEMSIKYCIVIFENNYNVDGFSRYHQVLSFPTEEMAIDFMNCFKDLLNTARLLI